MNHLFKFLCIPTSNWTVTRHDGHTNTQWGSNGWPHSRKRPHSSGPLNQRKNSKAHRLSSQGQRGQDIQLLFLLFHLGSKQKHKASPHRCPPAHLLLCYYEPELHVGGPCSNMQPLRVWRESEQAREGERNLGSDWMDGIAVGQDCGIRRDNGMLEIRKALCVK